MRKSASFFLIALSVFFLPLLVRAAEPNPALPLCVEAEVLEISTYPAPEKLDYPNCLVAVKIRVNQILSGPPTPEFCEALVMLYRNKIQDRRIAGLLKAHQKVKLNLIDFESAPEAIRETQQANDFTDIDGTQYFVTEAVALSEFSPVLLPRTFKGRKGYRSLWENPINPPRPPEVWLRRQVRMEKKRAEVAALLRSARESVIPDITVGEALTRENISYRTLKVFSQDIAFCIRGRSLFCIPVKRRMRERGIVGEEDCKRLKKLDEFFRRQQIELMVVLIPDAYSFAGRVIFPSMRNIPDLAYYDAALKLLDNGIEPVMLYPQLLDRWREFELLFGYQNYDWHPHFGMAEIGGRVLADILHEHGIDDPGAKKDFTETRLVCGYPEHVGKAFGLDTFSMSAVSYRGKNILPDAPDSPVLILGNSFARAPQYRASIPCRMALHSGVVPDLLKCEGIGVATIIPKRLLLNGDRYLRNKKICFLVLHPSFIKNYPWADIQALDGIYAAMSTQGHAVEISPESLKIDGAIDRAPADRAAQRTVKYHKDGLPSGWLVFHSPGTGKSHNRLVCTLPEVAVADRPRILCLAAFASQTMKIVVGQTSETLYANRDTLIFKLPAGTREFTLELTANQVYALGPIKILDQNNGISE